VQGLNVNFAKKDFWQDFQKEWTEVSETRMQNFIEQAESSKDMAKHQNYAFKNATVAVPSPESLSLPSSGRSSTGSAAGLSSGTILVCYEKQLPVPDGTIAQPCPVRPTSSSCKPEFPVSVDLVQDAMDGSTVVKQEKSFNAMATSIECPRPNEFPVVKYPVQCNGLCRCSTPATQLAMQEALFGALDRLCRGFVATRSDLFMVCEAQDDEIGADVVCFVSLVSSSGRRGRFRPSQGFLVYDVVQPGQGGDHAGAVLQVACEAPIAFHPELPGVFRYFGRCGSGQGAPKVLTEGEFTAQVLKGSPAFAATWPTVVTLRFLDIKPHVSLRGRIDNIQIVGPCTVLRETEEQESRQSKKGTSKQKVSVLFCRVDAVCMPSFAIVVDVGGCDSGWYILWEAS
jgi:hypothetical protein